LILYIFFLGYQEHYMLLL